MAQVRTFAPGRVNLIGEHTDYTGGLCLPMAVSLGVTVTGTPGGDRLVLASEHADGVADMPLTITDPATIQPDWARYVAGVVAELRPATGLRGTVASTVPMGAGMSSSAALELAVALALGFTGPPLALAQLCQRAEQRASGVPCGILDQLASASGVAGHALLLDCRTLSVEPVPVPEDIDVVVVHSGQARTLVGSEYADRRAQCEAAESIIGPLRDAQPEELSRIDDPVLRARARHVVTENQRVLDAVDALRAGDARRLGGLLDASHRSLRDDFAVSTPVVDATVDRIRRMPGVHGARLMGGGFGGCVVAVCEPGSVTDGWVVRPGPGARIEPS